MRREKFRHGDLVRIASNLGPTMEHFTGKGARAIVIGSYRDQYGGSNTKDYTLFIEGQGECSWYEEHQLTLLGHNPELLDTWEDQIAACERDESDLKWIAAHWETLREGCSSTVILALFAAADFQSSFLRNGEYYCLWRDWYEAFPFIDFVMRCATLEELRAKQSDKADPTVVESAEAFWRKLHS